MSRAKRPSIYLSGPLTGRSQRSAESWRDNATERLASKYEIIDPASYAYEPEIAYRKRNSQLRIDELAQHGIRVIARNKRLLKACDVVLANFLGSKNHASIGSIGEVFLANAYKKPVLLVREKEGNVHNHAMLNAVATVVVYNLEDAYRQIPQLLAVRSKSLGVRRVALASSPKRSHRKS